MLIVKALPRGATQASDLQRGPYDVALSLFAWQEGELIEDDEFADFEKHDNARGRVGAGFSPGEVAFSFVRHNRYEAIEASL